MRAGWHRGIWPGFAGLCLAALAAMPASAKTHHYYNGGTASSYSAVPGPTSPGVSSILIDAQTGAVLSAQQADVERYPASLTKLMTLDLAFQALQDGRLTLDTRIPVSYHAQAVEPVKLGLLAGQTISVRDAILAMTTMSANDAATALGEYLGGGSEARCAQMMTARAQTLGMTGTRFMNASGLPNAAQVTTAHDMAILARDIVVHYPQFQSFFEVTSFEFRGRPVYSNNQMLKLYPGTTGMKTGYTDLARFNLVTSAERNGRELIGVVLHEPGWSASYRQMTAMLNSGFAGAPDMGAEMASIAPPPAPLPHVTYGTPALPLPPVREASALPPPPPAAPVQRVADRAHGEELGGWVAQLGVFSYSSSARSVAVNMRRLRGVGVARIARLQHDGRTLWSAQLAGLSYHAAHKTCDVLAARGDSCLVLAPSADHLAMLTGDSGT